MVSWQSSTRVLFASHKTDCAEMREAKDANAGACAGIRVRHGGSPKATAKVADYSSISDA